jgi:hypothetical protein
MYINNNGKNYRENNKKDYNLSAYFRVFDKTTSDYVSYLQIFSFYKVENFSVYEILNENNSTHEEIHFDDDIYNFYENPKKFLEDLKLLDRLRHKKEISNSRVFIVIGKNKDV